MSKTIEIIYENGVLRPLGPVPLREHERATLLVCDLLNGDAELLDTECLEACHQEGDEAVSLEDVRKALAKIPGTMTADFIAERDE